MKASTGSQHLGTARQPPLHRAARCVPGKAEECEHSSCLLMGSEYFLLVVNLIPALEENEFCSACTRRPMTFRGIYF